ncbi:MAG TPA: hypothetical protein VK190_04485 [Pseudoneobacillus sp.]|nr:hypothetical protein [Pseudoneobacillus sp.]
MSTNKTTNFLMHSWVGTDYVKRTEFNDNFNTIDTELKNAKDSAATANSSLSTHTADGAAHGATSAATASKIMMRDASGRAKVAAPSASDDIARKDTVDAVQTNLTNHIGTGGTAHAAVIAGGANGFMTGADKTKLDGIATGANNYVHPTGDGNSHVPANGTTNANKVLKATGTAGSYTWASVNASELVQDASNRLVTDTEKTSWNGKASTAVATTSANGLMSSTDKSKLDTAVVATQTLADATDLNTVITSGFYRLGATVTNGPTGVGYGQLIVSRGGDTIVQIITGYNNSEYYMRQGNGIGATATFQPWRKMWHDGNFDPATKASTAVVTTSANGLMASTDKSKLDGIAAGAQVNTVTSVAGKTGAVTLGAADITTDASNRFVTDSDKTNWNGKASTAVATTGANGLMSSTDKSKLDGVSTGANKATVGTVGSGNIEIDGVSKNVYTHPASHAASMITEDSTHRFVTDTEKTAWNNKLGLSTYDIVENTLLDTLDFKDKNSGKVVKRLYRNGDLKVVGQFIEVDVMLTGANKVWDEGLTELATGDVMSNVTMYSDGLGLTQSGSNYLSSGYRLSSYDLNDVNLVGNSKINFASSIIKSTTYDRTTSTQVASSAYDTSGNGGRKLVRLSNGWLVAMLYDSVTVKLWFKVSKDNGATWVDLCNYTRQGADTVYSGGSITSVGTKVHVVIPYYDASSSTYYYISRSFDATTITNINMAPTNGTAYTSSTVDPSSCTSLGTTSIAADSNGNLWATWASKVGSYTNSLNICYSTSTDDGVTWATKKMITVINTAGVNNQNPTIFVRNDNTPIIVFEGNTRFTSPTVLSTTSGNRAISALIYTGGTTGTNSSGFSGYTIYYNTASYTQSNPSAVIDSSGAIHVTWQGYDATDTGVYNIRYSKSTDGGLTWVAAIKLTSGNTYTNSSPSITADKNNNIYILWNGVETAISTSYFNIRKMVYSGTAWGSATSITNNTTGDALSPATLINITDFTEPLVIYQDKQAVSVKFRGKWVDSASVTSANVDRSTTPATIAASAQSTAGVGGRKLVRLSDGTLITASQSSSTVTVYKSTDNGSTWTSIYTYACTTYFDHCLVANGMNFHLFITNWISSTYYLRHIKLDVTGTAVIGMGIIMSGTGYTGVVSADMDTNGILHVACEWQSTTSVGHNIGYAKSTDGGSTWSSNSGICGSISTSINYADPALVIKTDGNPLIVYKYTAGSAYNLGVVNYTGSTWSKTDNAIYGSTSSAYQPKSPSAVVDSNGIIHVTFIQTDPTDTGPNHIRYTKSTTTAGSAWGTVQKLTSGGASSATNYDQSYGTITVDKNNKIYITWTGRDGTSSTYHLRRITSTDGATWSAISLLESGVGQSYPSSLVEYNDFTDPPTVYTNTVTPAFKFRGVFIAPSSSPTMSIKVEASLDNATWTQVYDDGPIAVLSYGQDVKGKTLYIRATLNTTEPTLTPKLTSIGIVVNSMEG